MDTIKTDALTREDKSPPPSGNVAVLFFARKVIRPIFIGQMPFLAPTLDNDDPIFVLVIAPVFIWTTYRWRIKTQLVAAMAV